MSVLHVADATGRTCRDCGATWYNAEKGSGLTVEPGCRIEHAGRGIRIVGVDSWHPLDADTATTAEPCIAVRFLVDGDWVEGEPT